MGTKRCCICKKKLSLVESQLVCKCSNNYCSYNFDANLHNCKFDYKNEQRKILQKQLNIVIEKKIDLI